MKKKITKSFIMMSGIAFLFTSCLKDGDTSTSRTNDFAYITQTEGGVKYASTVGGYYLTSPAIESDLNVGDCATISYKVSLSNQGANGIFKADYATIEESFPYSKQKRTLIQDVSTEELENVINGINDLTMYWPYALPHLGNRIQMKHTTNLTEGQNYTLEFYYDANKQLEGSENKFNKILDVRMIVTGDPKEGEKPKKKVTNVILDMTNLRSLFEVDANANKDVIKIGFRYHKLDKDGVKAPLQIGDAEAIIVYDKKSE